MNPQKQLHWDDVSGLAASRLPTVLGDTTLTAQATSISLDSLNLTDWRIVRIICILRHATATEGSGNWERAILRFNDDANAANYLWEVLNADTTHVDNTSVGYNAGIEAGHMTGPNWAAPHFAQNFIDLVLPGETSHYKVSHLQGSMPNLSAALATTGTGIWLNTAPITKVSIVANEAGTNLEVGCRLIAIGLV